MKRNKVVKLMSLVSIVVVITVVALVRDNQQVVMINSKNCEEQYDVIVVGSDPEGIAAALSSARNGLETLLVDTRDSIGGLMTVGGLNTIDMNFGPKNQLLTQGIFEEFFNKLHPFNFTKIQKFSRYSFDVEIGKKSFIKMLNAEENITVMLGVEGIGPVVKDNQIIGVEVQDNKEVKEIKSSRVIDATQDADIAAASGVPYYTGMTDLNKEEHQAVTLVFKVNNVDWRELRHALRKDSNKYSSDANRYSAWGFSKIMGEYIPVHDNVKVRGPNIGLQDDGSVLINAIQILNINGLDAEQKREALEIGEIEARKVTDYMREHLPGFEQSEFGGVVEELYIRETRHIEGEYTLDIIDLIENRDFEDKIALASYPIDIQTTSMDNKGYVVGAPDTYSIPFRCIVPKYIDNLLVVGRAASYSSLAHGSSRVIPIGMAVGEAAGVASAYSIAHEIGFREISSHDKAIKEIQTTLKKQGAYLEDFNYDYAYKDYWAEEGVRFMLRMGILNGGYTNDFGLEKEITETKFLNWLIESLKRSGVGTNRVNMNFSDKLVTKEEAAKILCSFMNQEVQKQEALLYLKDMGILSVDTYNNVLKSEEFTIGEACQMIYEFNKYQLNP